jgi:hypothetical protein
MRTFTLLLEDDDAEHRRVQFDAIDSSAAFSLLERELTARRATLWENEQRLGTIVRNEGDFWEVSA